MTTFKDAVEKNQNDFTTEFANDFASLFNGTSNDEVYYDGVVTENFKTIKGVGLLNRIVRNEVLLFIFALAFVTCILEIANYIHVKGRFGWWKLSPTDRYIPFKIMSFSLQIWDFISDALFCSDLNEQYVNNPNNGNYMNILPS